MSWAKGCPSRAATPTPASASFYDTRLVTLSFKKSIIRNTQCFPLAAKRCGPSYSIMITRVDYRRTHKAQPLHKKRLRFGKQTLYYVLPGQNGLITYCYFRPTLWARHDWPIQLPAHARALTPERSQQAHPSHLRAILFWDRPWDLWGP